MASRLSDVNLKRRYDVGHLHLVWNAPKPNENLLQLNFDRLLADPRSKNLIQSIPSQVLYHALLQSTAAQRKDVLACVSSEQFTRLIDYDVWPEDEIDRKKFLGWLLQLKSKEEPDAMAKKFKAIDEEYQIALLEKYVRLLTKEEAEALSSDNEFSLITLPCQKYCYQIRSEDKEVVEGIKELIDSCLAFDMDYAYLVLAHATYMPPNESEHQLSQFRRARLEEDGFVSFEESLKAFWPIEVESVKTKWRIGYNPRRDLGLVEVSPDTDYLDIVVADAMKKSDWTEEDGLLVQQGFLFLANCLCSAVRIDPSDLEGLNKMLEQIRALSSLGLEHLAAKDTVLAARILRTEQPKVLFRVGLSLIFQLQVSVLDKLEALQLKDIPKIRHLQRQQKWGELGMLLDNYISFLDLQRVEMLKGLFNRFPMRPDLALLSDRSIQFKTIGSVAALNSLSQIIDSVVNDIRESIKTGHH